MNLHGKIMNIPVDQKSLPESGEERLIYKIGHRDARHEAAEIAIKTDRLMEEMHDALEGLLSWCEEIAGDNVDTEAAQHEETTVQYARKVLNEYEKEIKQ